MITVSISINGKEIHSVYGVNVSEELGHEYGHGKQFYQLDLFNDQIIEHNFEDGAIKLAIKMLETMEEVNDRTKYNFVSREI